MTTMLDARRPAVVSKPMQEAFEVQARRLNLRPGDKWVGGYVDYEWEHLRHIAEALPLELAGLKLLEFGCNVGASAILFAHMGARVTASDISEGYVELARLNAARYGKDGIDFAFIPDSRALPYADSQFDVIACNSVLEYVEPCQIAAVQREIDRVLAPGGLILLTGTSNRLWPREAHSHRWLVNYLPRWFDRLLASPPQRGMSPWMARHGFGPGYDNLDLPRLDGFFARSRLAMGMPPKRLASLLRIARLLGVGPGLLTPNLSCLLKKHK
ncbi:class I SAM-dependent methyltransferase [Massilia glaciei]|uniref:Class I SAM-dependent methyltransferase n=1 Tax=Massilia glaciei TaxID=1524097 RepID=A0A2U2HJ38_9BURK|nr:class I SAM-dependent methyltransferase [Massilia glaciei]PWF46770.1 class I SAM-dependent methyltransferase [Massilia glaciei]